MESRLFKWQNVKVSSRVSGNVPPLPGTRECVPEDRLKFFWGKNANGSLNGS